MIKLNILTANINARNEQKLIEKNVIVLNVLENTAVLTKHLLNDANRNFPTTVLFHLSGQFQSRSRFKKKIKILSTDVFVCYFSFYTVSNF